MTEQSGKGCKVLIIVENLPVPFDTRVWKEAQATGDSAGMAVSQRTYLPCSASRLKSSMRPVPRVPILPALRRICVASVRVQVLAGDFDGDPLSYAVATPVGTPMPAGASFTPGSLTRPDTE